MCLPVIAVVAAGVAAAGAYKAANAQNAVSEYQGRVDANNAQIQEWEAADAKTRGDLAVNQNRRKQAGMEGAQIATLAAKGLDVGYGSPNALVTDTDYFGAYDESTIRANSRREAWGHDVQAQNYLNDAQFLADQRKANNPFIAGGMAFASTALTYAALNQAPGSGGSTYDYRGTELPGGLRGSTGYGGNSLLTSSGMVADRWYGI